MYTPLRSNDNTHVAAAEIRASALVAATGNCARCDVYNLICSVIRKV